MELFGTALLVVEEEQGLRVVTGFQIHWVRGVSVQTLILFGQRLLEQENLDIFPEEELGGVIQETLVLPTH